MIAKETIEQRLRDAGYFNTVENLWKGDQTENGEFYCVNLKQDEYSVFYFDGAKRTYPINESKYQELVDIITMGEPYSDCETIPEHHTFEDIHGSIEEEKTMTHDELTHEQRMEVAGLVSEQGYDKDTAISIVLGEQCLSIIENKKINIDKNNIITNHEYTPDQVNTIRNTVAKGASDDELSMFMHIANTYGLDPFMKEIFYSSQMKTIMTSRDGYLKIAQRDPDFDGIQSMAVCENDDFSIDMQKNIVNHTFGKGERGKVIGAWAICYHKKRRPVIAYADYSEYNKNNNIWNTYKSAMTCKVAEGFSLKRQFGISGLVTMEEIE